MRHWTTGLVGFTLGATLALAAQPGADPMADAVTRAAVTAVKQGIVAGHRTRDRAALDRLYADDYTALDARGGIRHKHDLLDALPSDPEMLEGRYTLTSVRRWGTVAVASGHGRMVERQGRWWYLAAFLP